VPAVDDCGNDIFVLAKDVSLPKKVGKKLILPTQINTYGVISQNSI
jgi:hypothetical protein